MKIDYENTTEESKTVVFSGETEDGRKFTIRANWNNWDDWNVQTDEVMFDSEDGTDEEKAQIIEEFLARMNG